MTDQHHNAGESAEEFAWVRRAYQATPAASPVSVAAVKIAAREIVSTQTHGELQPRQQRVVITLTHLRSQWARWMPAVAAIAIVCIVTIWQSEEHNLSPSKPQHTNGSLAVVSHPRTLTVATSSHDTSLRKDNEKRSIRVARGTASNMIRSDVPLIPDTEMTASVVPTPRTDSAATHNSLSPFAPTADLDLSSHTRTTEGLDPESAVLVQGILDSASARGLPLAALTSRVREGVRRRVPGPRVVVVTRNFATALSDASIVLGPAASSAETQSGAEALVSGAPVAALRQIRLARPVGSVDESLVALADLAAHGVAPLRASTALASLIAQGQSDEPVRALRAAVIGNILQGESPNAALADQVRHTPVRESPAQPPLVGLPDSSPLPGHTP